MTVEVVCNSLPDGRWLMVSATSFKAAAAAGFRLDQDWQRRFGGCTLHSGLLRWG